MLARKFGYVRDVASVRQRFSWILFSCIVGIVHVKCNIYTWKRVLALFQQGINRLEKALHM